MTELAMQPLSTTRFLRKTTLQPNERNTNFSMLDNDIIEAISSPEADKITPLMSKIYLRLRSTPCCFLERDGVLHFAGQMQGNKWVKAWNQLCQHLRVSSETAHKALSWMHDQGIIGYSAFKNGVGIRIFLNRAASSISIRVTPNSEKNLQFPPASPADNHATVSEAAFKDQSFKNSLDKEYKSGAPKHSADTASFDEVVISQTQPNATPPLAKLEAGRLKTATLYSNNIPVNEIVKRLKYELMPCVKSAATQSAVQATAREAERTRIWFETRAMPKAVRVAQSETYNLLKKLGTLDALQEHAHADLQVGCSPLASEYEHLSPQPLTAEEIMAMAETCIALLEMQGREIETTLTGMNAQSGGWLLAEDVSHVRAKVQALMLEKKG